MLQLNSEYNELMNCYKLTDVQAMEVKTENDIIRMAFRGW